MTLNADPDQLEQMFINLLANAVDASLANGAQPVRAFWRLDDAALVVTIEDRGMGIAKSCFHCLPECSRFAKAAASNVIRIGMRSNSQTARTFPGMFSQDGPPLNSA